MPEPDTENPVTEEDFLACIPLNKHLEKIPLGHMIYITGEELWRNGNGVEFTTEEWIAEYKFDPNVAWTAKKKYLAAHPKGGVTKPGNAGKKFKRLGRA